MITVTKRSTLGVWRDVVFAIFLREIKSKFADRVGISWALIQPVSFIIVLSLLRGSLDGGDTHTMPTVVFISHGMLFILLFINTMSSAASSIQRNKQLFAFRQVQPIASTIAGISFQFLVKVFVAIIIALALYIIRIDFKIHEPISVILCFISVWLLGANIGMLFALAKCFIPEVDKLRALIQRPLLFISGAFFSLQDIPKDSWKYFDWNPILHAIELSRQAAYPTFGVVGVDSTYLMITTMSLTFFSLACYRAVWKQAISR